MKSKAFILAVCISAAGIYHQNSGEAVAEEDVEIPSSYDVRVKSSLATVIYGQFNKGCHQTEAPSFEWVMNNAVTQMPVNGTLSDGGVGMRLRQRCGREVSVRAVSYTSKADFIGIDGVVFWNEHAVVITVVPDEDR